MPKTNMDPFADDDAGDDVTADVERLKRRMGATEEKDDESSGGGEDAIAPTTLELEPDQEMVLDTDPEPAPRDEKRQERSSLHAAFEGQRDENARLKERLAHIEGRMSAPQRPASRSEEPPEDPADSDITGLQQQQQDIHTLWQKTKDQMPAEEQTALRTRAREVDDKLQELKFARHARKAGLRPALSREAEDQRQMSGRFRQENPDIYGNKQAHQVALGLFAKAQYRGEPESIALHDRVMHETRKQLGMETRNRRPDPTDEQRQRYAGRPTGARSPLKPGQFRMEKHHRAMADTAFPNIKDPTKRYQHFAQTVGKRLLRSHKA